MTDIRASLGIVWGILGDPQGVEENWRRARLEQIAKCLGNYWRTLGGCSRQIMGTDLLGVRMKVADLFGSRFSHWCGYWFSYGAYKL